MDENILLKVALSVSVIGIIVLFLISTQIELSDTTIEKITSGSAEDKVSVTGTIKSIRQTGSATFILLTQASDLDVVVFSENLSMDVGETIKVTGKVQDYKGKKEIMADSIKILDQ
jgi:aspartyl/asparaginyl-tRNA synthetase